MNKNQLCFALFLLFLIQVPIFASHLREMCQKINVTLAEEYEKAIREQRNFPPLQLLNSYQKPTISSDGKIITYPTGLKKLRPFMKEPIDLSTDWNALTYVM